MHVPNQPRRTMSMLTRITSIGCAVMLLISSLAIATPPSGSTPLIPTEAASQAFVDEAGVVNIMTAPQTQKSSFIKVRGSDVAISPFAIDGKMTKHELVTWVIIPLVLAAVGIAEHNNFLGTSNSGSSPLSDSDSTTYNCGVGNSGDGDVSCDFSGVSSVGE